MPAETVVPTGPVTPRTGLDYPGSPTAPSARRDQASASQEPVDRVELSPEARELAREVAGSTNEHELDLQLSQDELQALTSGERETA